MTAPLILGVDSGLDGAFAWMRGGVVLHHVLTRTLVADGRIDTVGLERHHDDARGKCEPWAPRVAYLEEPFNPGMAGRANSVGFAGSCMRFGRLQGWLESWGYEVRGVRPQAWQREILDLARFEVRTEKECAPRLAEGWKLTRLATIGRQGWWRLTAPREERREFRGDTRSDVLAFIAGAYPESITRTKQVLSHDTKAAAIAYAREHFPGVELVPPRCKNPHDGLADAICIAALATKKETP